jgi:hypothetical protein
MEVIISHQNTEWKIIPIDKDFILNSFNSKLEAKMYAKQNNYQIKSFECNINCKICRLK